MSKESKAEFDMAPLLIVALMILAGLCVWCIARTPEVFLQGAK